MGGDVRGFGLGVDHHVRALGRLVGVVDAGELLDQPGARLGVRPLVSRCSQTASEVAT